VSAVRERVEVLGGEGDRAVRALRDDREDRLAFGVGEARVDRRRASRFLPSCAVGGRMRSGDEIATSRS